MQKIGRASAQVAGRFLFLGVSVQILLGICWGVRSFGIFPEFGDSPYDCSEIHHEVKDSLED